MNVVTKGIALCFLLVAAGCSKSEEPSPEGGKSPEGEHIYKLERSINYAEDGTEKSRTEFSYDAKRRVIGLKLYSDGELISEQKNYKYNDLKVTFEDYSYNYDGTVVKMRNESSYLKWTL